MKLKTLTLLTLVALTTGGCTNELPETTVKLTLKVVSDEAKALFDEAYPSEKQNHYSQGIDKGLYFCMKVKPRFASADGTAWVIKDWEKNNDVPPESCVNIRKSYQADSGVVKLFFIGSKTVQDYLSFTYSNVVDRGENLVGQMKAEGTYTDAEIQERTFQEIFTYKFWIEKRDGGNKVATMLPALTPEAIENPEASDEEVSIEETLSVDVTI